MVVEVLKSAKILVFYRFLCKKGWGIFAIPIYWIIFVH